MLLAAVLGVAGWVAFLTYVTNQEMISSSIVRQIMRCVREDPKLREVLGEAIRSQPEWWLNGDPKINGRVRLGFVDFCRRAEKVTLSAVVMNR